MFLGAGPELIPQASSLAGWVPAHTECRQVRAWSGEGRGVCIETYEQSPRPQEAWLAAEETLLPDRAPPHTCRPHPGRYLLRGPGSPQDHTPGTPRLCRQAGEPQKVRTGAHGSSQRWPPADPLGPTTCFQL